MTVHDFEKLGAFYIGKRVDEESHKQTEELILYDSKDLTTHAVIIGMTGSGKTGLGIGILEEAAMDHIPVIAIDPKGDMGNMLLTFPMLAADDFKPWVNPRQATDAGQTIDQFAKSQAALWERGLGKWGQDKARIKKLRDNVDMSIYTPGSNAGLPISVLSSFRAPEAALRDDIDLYRDRVQATATSILSLLRIKADPVSSREHILISKILDHAWQADCDLSLAALINEIQRPPVERIGVMDLDTFYPAGERFKLAMKINNLLAAPGFEAWIEGESLNTGKLLYTDSGRPRISIMSIAHLDDAERMFFVCMLLNDIIAWMRAQPGTSSLRAILYMDELFGFMPPVENPPSKKLFLTLLKQARAYGLGLVLSTQNPVDLDYRGLSNTGTWMIGRLQTKRDKARVMEGLEGAALGEAFDKQAMEQTLAGLGKRRFLLHNVHEDKPVIFNTRWVMSYLAGPLTRDQIRKLSEPTRRGGTQPDPAVREIPAKPSVESPLLPPSIQQFYFPTDIEAPVYVPHLIAATDVTFSNRRYKIDEKREAVYLIEVADETVVVNWDNAETITFDIESLDSSPVPGATFADYPGAVAQPKNYALWSKELKRWIRQNETVSMYKSPRFRVTSKPGEGEGEFRVRLQQVASEKRDLEVGKLRKRYASKVRTLENRLLRAQQTIEREQQQASQKKFDSALSFGTAILGVVLGRKRLSKTNATSVGSAIRKAGSARKEAGDVARAKEVAEKVQQDLVELDVAMNAEVEALNTQFDAQLEDLDEIPVRPKTTDIHVGVVGLAWVPYADAGRGRLKPAFIQ